jgi:NTP pyrophosphatase (non-canonical NTP hydrolase)
MSINLTEYAWSVHQNAVNKGFWDNNNGINFYIKQCAMIHSEVSEVVEAIAKDKGEQQIVDEMADIIIRLCDLWAGMNHDGIVKIQLEDALRDKAEYNKTRPRMHGKLA